MYTVAPFVKSELTCSRYYLPLQLLLSLDNLAQVFSHQEEMVPRQSENKDDAVVVQVLEEKMDTLESESNLLDNTTATQKYPGSSIIVPACLSGYLAKQQSFENRILKLITGKEKKRSINLQR
jgi:hypothetical protein